MQARFITADQLRTAATEIGVTVEIRTLNQKGDRHQVKVNPLGKLGERNYQRTSAGMDDTRRVWAVCWHGFRDFFRACYAQAPDAVFRTGLDTWKGSDDFEARFRQSGHTNVGSPMCPRSACEVCECPDSGMAG